MVDYTRRTHQLPKTLPRRSARAIATACTRRTRALHLWIRRADGCHRLNVVRATNSNHCRERPVLSLAAHYRLLLRSTREAVAIPIRTASQRYRAKPDARFLMPADV